MLPSDAPCRPGIRRVPSPAILRLALPSPLRRLFDYLPPRGVDVQRLQPGVRLRVPFGRREMVGVLVDKVDTSDVPADKLRPALAVYGSASARWRAGSSRPGSDARPHTRV